MKLLERLRQMPSPVEPAPASGPGQPLGWSRDEFHDPASPEAFEPVLLDAEYAGATAEVSAVP